jgi:hypothetical protein
MESDSQKKKGFRIDVYDTHTSTGIVENGNPRFLASYIVFGSKQVAHLNHKFLRVL